MLFTTNTKKMIGLLLGILFFFVCILLSVVLGYTDTNFKMVIDSFVAFDGSNEHLIIQTTRIPRSLIAAAVGASLGIAGAILQALTKNPLASPTIFGINAGAGFFIVVAISIFSVSSLYAFTWLAFIGAAVTSFLVYFLGSFGREGLTPMKLTLAGAAMASLFASFTQGLLVLNEKALQEALFWLAGSVQGRKLETLLIVLPYLVVGWIASLLMANKINVLAMGEDVAKGLGQKTAVVKFISIVIVVLLSGGSVAVAGPIIFVGIVVPHVSRFLVGTDHRWIIPYCAVLGGIFLMLADISARYIIMPQEVPVGVMTAIIGTPFFVYVARRGM